MKTLKHTAALIAALALLSFTGGCATSKAQRALHKATEALGATVATSVTAFNTYMVIQAKDKLGPDATIEQQKVWVVSQPEWIKANNAHMTYAMAYRAWVESNAVAVSGDSASTIDLALVVQAAQDYFALVAMFIPSITPQGQAAIADVKLNLR